MGNKSKIKEDFLMLFYIHVNDSRKLLDLTGIYTGISSDSTGIPLVLQ